MHKKLPSWTSVTRLPTAIGLKISVDLEPAFGFISEPKNPCGNLKHILVKEANRILASFTYHLKVATISTLEILFNAFQ